MYVLFYHKNMSPIISGKGASVTAEVSRLSESAGFTKILSKVKNNNKKMFLNHMDNVILSGTLLSPSLPRMNTL